MQSMAVLKYLLRGPSRTCSGAVFYESLDGVTVVGRGKSGVGEDLLDLLAACFSSFRTSLLDFVAMEALLFETLFSV